VGGFCLAMVAWVARAQDEFGEVNYGTMMSDWPWVMGNIAALCGGTAIAFVGSVIWPNSEFKWAHLNETIPLVDDVEPPPEDEIYKEEQFLSFMTKLAAGISIGGTFFLIFLWPVPMHLWSGVFSEAGFTVWITLDFLWLIAAGGVIIVLPAYELRNVFSEYKSKVDNLKLKPGNAGQVATKVEEGEGSAPKAKIVDSAEKKKVTELQNKVKELEEHAKKDKAATEATAKELQEKLRALTEENDKNKKAIAAAKKAAAKPKPKVLPPKKKSNEETKENNEEKAPLKEAAAKEAAKTEETNAAPAEPESPKKKELPPMPAPVEKSPEVAEMPAVADTGLRSI